MFISLLTFDIINLGGFVLKIFLPDLYIENFQRLSVDFLKQKKIKLLICDIDNTLVPYDQHKPNEEVVTFINKIKANDIILVLISNNKTDRVKEFADGLDLAIYPMAHKPLKKAYLQVLQEHNLDKSMVAAIGDQLLTDVLGAKRCGIYAILAKPLVKRDINYTKINRFIEKFVYWILTKFYGFDKGRFDEQV